MKCPVCGVELKMAEYQGIEIGAGDMNHLDDLEVF